MDTFIEYMVKKKKTGTDLLKILGVVAAALLLTVAFGFLVTITPRELFLLWFAIVVALWYGVYIIVSRQNIEYEYTFTNGELDIDAVYSKRRRVHLLTVRVKEFIFCAPAYDEHYKEQYLNVSGIKRYYKAAGRMDSDNVYFADFLLNGDKMRLFFEPSKKMIEAVKRFNMRNVHVRGE